MEFKLSKRRKLESDGLDLIFALLNRANYKEYIERTGSVPSICLPRSATEKFLWRKVFDHNPQFSLFTDKLAVKDYLTNTFPEVPYAKVLWQGDDIRLAPPDLLGGPGFLKANHACNTNLNLGTKSLEIDELHAKTQEWLKLRWHTVRGQWSYKDVKPTLFIEEDLTAGTGEAVLDINVFVLGDTVSHFTVIVGSKTDHVQYARYDPSGRRLDAAWAGKKVGPLPADYELPVAASQVCELAKKIAGGSDHLRIDFMWNGQALHLCEITVYSHGGYGFVGTMDSALLGKIAENWDLRRSWFLTHPQTGWRRLYAAWLRRTLNERDPGLAPCEPKDLPTQAVNS